MVRALSLQQLALALSPKSDYIFDRFWVSPRNQSVFLQLDDFLKDQRLGYAYLYGEKGSGKSHVLQAACQQAQDQKIQAIYLPMAVLKKYKPTVFENLEYYQLICVDDIQEVVGSAQWEEALFHLFNRIAEQKRQLLISGNVSIKQLTIRLPDLSSRLVSGLSFELHGLTEAEEKAVLQARAKTMGLLLSDEILEFLFKRLQRDMGTLSNALETLDKASLQAQRKLTIPFVKQVLKL